MIPSSNFLLTHWEWVIVTLGSGSPAIELFFLQTTTLKCSLQIFRLYFLAPVEFQILQFSCYVTEQPQIWRPQHEVEGVDIVVTSLMSHALRGFSAENWTRSDAQEVVKEHEQYHFVKRKHLTKTQDVFTISSFPQEIRKLCCIPWSSG